MSSKIEIRREKVKRLMLMYYPPVKIAKELKMNIDCVKRDIKAIKKEMSEKIKINNKFSFLLSLFMY